MPFGISSRPGNAGFRYIIDNAYCVAANTTKIIQLFHSVKLFPSDEGIVILEAIVHRLRYNLSIRTEPFGSIYMRRQADLNQEGSAVTPRQNRICLALRSILSLIQERSGVPRPIKP
jgi:hypothetical protein